MLVVLPEMATVIVVIFVLVNLVMQLKRVNLKVVGFLKIRLIGKVAKKTVLGASEGPDACIGVIKTVLALTTKTIIAICIAAKGQILNADHVLKGLEII